MMNMRNFNVKKTENYISFVDLFIKIIIFMFFF